MLQVQDITYKADGTIFVGDSPGGDVKLTSLDYMHYSDFNPREYLETWVGRKLTDREYAVYLYKGRWNNVLRKFAGKIPNDFKSKKHERE